MSAPWTGAEIQRLKRLYEVMTYKELAIAFAPRTLIAIQRVAARLKLRKRRKWLDIARSHQPTFTFGVQP